MKIIIFAMLIGLIPASIAQRKGKDFMAWWIYGSFIFIAALPHALILKADSCEIEKRQLAEGMKKCPFCAEIIKRDAILCRFCQRELNN